jgi:hypothetical protein
VVAARERFVFLFRCALIAALVASLWSFHGMYLNPAAGADDDAGPSRR